MEVDETITQQKNLLVSQSDNDKDNNITESGNISVYKAETASFSPPEPVQEAEIVQETTEIVQEADTIQELESPIQDSEPSVQKPEPPIRESEPIGQEPDPIVQEPDPIVQEPDPIVQEPDPILQEPVPGPIVRKRSPKKKLASSGVFSPEKRTRIDSTTTPTQAATPPPPPPPTMEAYRFSMWTITEIQNGLKNNGVTRVDNINFCIKLFAVLTCSSYGDNPSEFLGTGYTVHTILSFLHQDCEDYRDHVSLVAYISKEDAFEVLLQNTLRLNDHLIINKPRTLASFAAKGAHIDDAEMAEDARLDAIGLVKAQEREKVRADERKAIRMAARPFPDTPLSDTELAAEADILRQEEILVQMEASALLADYQNFVDLLPSSEIIRPLVDWAFQKRRGPKDPNLQDIIHCSSVIKSIMVLESSHRLKITNVRLIFSSVRKARFAKLQLHFALHYILPTYRKILFVCQHNSPAALSYALSNWKFYHFSLQDEIFTPKYDGRLYLCMRGEIPPEPPSESGDRGFDESGDDGGLMRAGMMGV